jgi:hypothetical protein
LKNAYFYRERYIFAEIHGASTRGTKEKTKTGKNARKEETRGETTTFTGVKHLNMW